MKSQHARHFFQPTRWSVVQRAASPDHPEAREALASICEAYWYPLYAFIRRSGHAPHDAQDLTQGFFARLMQKETLAAADPAKGRLRSFLLTCVGRYLSDERDRARAQKRGAAVLVSFDPAWAEKRYATEPVDDLAPDRLFQRRWAITVLESSLAALGEEYAARGKGDLFTALRPFLGFSPESEQRYEDVSAALSMPTGTVKSHVFRLRERWRQLLFEQVGATLNDPTPTEIKAELAELLSCV